MTVQTVTAGFLPLTDSVLLVIARHKGFAEDEGIDLRLMRETSWANIRDRIGVGHFDVAHMLAPMPIAANLGLAPLPVRLIAPMALGHGGNAVTVSMVLWSAMQDEGAPDKLDAQASGQALARVIKSQGAKKRFGVVHQNSSHNYELRYWLAASGIMPDRDVEIVVLPPPLLPDALAEGAIDSYCVGEPWNSVGVASGAGRIVATKSAIWRASPDKVLGMRESWAERSPKTVAALIRAVYRAALWCSDPANLAEVAEVMAAPEFLGQPAELVSRALTGNLDLGGGASETVPDFYVPHRGLANFPSRSDALWFYSQMVRWGDVAHSPENATIAAEAFRPHLYRAALQPLGVALPADDAVQPGENRFFDGRNFDPNQLAGYLHSQSNRMLK